MTDPTPHPAICPVCGGAAVREVTTRDSDGVAGASFLCGCNHMWQTEWRTT